MERWSSNTRVNTDEESDGDDHERSSYQISDIKAKDEDSIGSVKLKRKLGVFEGVAVIIGCVVGSGIFVSPKGVLQYSGSVGLSLAVWVVSGLLSMLGALCFAELGTMIPESGGMYSYLFRAFGPVPAFLYMWVTTLTRNSAGTAVIAITFANYFIQLVLPNCEAAPEISARLFAAALICFLTWINCTNVRWVARVQNLFTVAKMGALVIIIVAGLFHLASGHLENYQSPMAGTSWTAVAISTAIYQSLFSYTGWDYLNVVIEEMKNPSRNLPLSIILSTSLITLLYTLTNVAYFAVLTPTEMLSSNAVAMTFGSRMLGVFGWTMPVFVMLSTFGATHSSVFTQSRLIFVGARRGHFPQALSLVSIRNYTPVPAAIFNGLTILAMLVVPDVSYLINYTAFSASVMHLASISALFWFRYKHPEWSRPFKVPLVIPVIFWFTQVFIMAITIVLAPLEVIGAIAIILMGLPVYYLTIYRQDVARCSSPAMEKMTVALQKVFFCLPENRGDLH